MSEWPLHVTLADTFACELNDTVYSSLASVCSNQAPLSIATGGTSTLGTTPVVLVDKTDALRSFHDALIELLESNGAQFNTPAFTKDGFLPHISIDSPDQIHAGQTFQLDSLSIIDMFPGGDWRQRKILRTFQLK